MYVTTKLFSLFQDSLSFPDDVSTSGEFQALVKSLLIDPDERLSYSQLKKHQFFNSVDWDHLLAGIHTFVLQVPVHVHHHHSEVHGTCTCMLWVQFVLMCTCPVRPE